MNIKLVTCVMIRNPETDEVLVQNRTKIYPGWNFPGGHVEPDESVYDCAVREVYEETGLVVSDLEPCGLIHWEHRTTHERYICHCYRTERFRGELVAVTPEGEQFWMRRTDLLSTDPSRFSSEYYALSPLFHEPGRYSEAYIRWSVDDDPSTYEVTYR